jgi:hypothetical protein
LLQLWFAGHVGHNLHGPNTSPASEFLKQPFRFQESLRPVIKAFISATEEDFIDWCILPIKKTKPVRIWIDDLNAQVMVLPGPTGGVEYHPIRVLRQLRHTQIHFNDATLPERFRRYPPDSIHVMHEINAALKEGISTVQLNVPNIAMASKAFLDLKEQYWLDPTTPPKCRGALRPQLPTWLETLDTGADANPEQQGQKRTRLN